MTASSWQQAEVGGGTIRRWRWGSGSGGGRLVVVRALAGLLVVLVVAGGLIVGQAKPASALTNYQPGYWHESGTNGTLRRSWMSTLQDGLPLSALTIPGTHDSGTFLDGITPQNCNLKAASVLYPCGSDATEGIMDLGVTQTMTFTQQLDAGIRALDIRLGQMANGTDCVSSKGQLFVVHGDKLCFKRTATDVFAPVAQFLASNPSETVVMKIQNDTNTPDNGDLPTDATFDNLLRSVIGQHRQHVWQYDGNDNPRLGDVRGKIVILQNGSVDDWSAAPVCTGGATWPACGQLGIPLWSPDVVKYEWNYGADAVTEMAYKWRNTQTAFEAASSGDIMKLHTAGLNATCTDDIACVVATTELRPKPVPFFFASGKSYSGTYDSQAPTPWTPLSCGPADACLSRDPGGFYYDGGWVYYKGINQLALEFINNAQMGRLGIVSADFPNPGRPTGDFYDQQGLIGMLIRTNDKVNARAKPTSTTLLDPATMTVGDDKWLAAAVSPNPGGGTVSFTSNGATILGCSAVPVRAADGYAFCKYSATSVGTFSIAATFSPAGVSASASTLTFPSTSPARNLQVVAPPTGVPDKPDAPTAAAGNGTVKVAWVAPSQGNSPISGYTVVASPDGASCTTTGATTCVVGPLDVTKTYTFTVSARNAQGTSPASDPSAQLTFPPAVGTAVGYAGIGIAGPQGITAGPDGAQWFVNSLDGTVGRISSTGEVSTVSAPVSSPREIATGPDGALWFTNGGDNSIVRVTTAGAVQKFTGSEISGPSGLAVGPDGAMWFTNRSNSTIGRITTTGVKTSFADASINDPIGIAAGPDGALWFTNRLTSSIGRITTGGSVSSFPVANIGNKIVGGPDGNLWFTVVGVQQIGRITPSGTVSTFTGPGISNPGSIAVGPDRALWFTNNNGTVGRITAAGVVTNHPGSGWSAPTGIAAGPDGNLWVSAGIGSASTIGTVWAGRVPQAPAKPTTLRGNQKVTVSWAPPPADPVFVAAYAPTSYKVTTFQGGVAQAATCTATAPATSCEVTGLTNGTSYTFSVTATNVIGVGPASAVSDAVAPSGAPAAPPQPTATKGNRLVTVAWDPPADPGASPVSAYAVIGYQLIPGPGQVWTPLGPLCAWTSGPRSCDVKNLSPNVQYKFVVVAQNGQGTSAPSPESEVVSPYLAPPVSLFHPLAVPTRILDSRPPPEKVGPYSTPWGPGTVRDVQVAGAGGVPANASSVTLNVTVTGTTAASFLTVWPKGADQPTASNLNWVAGQTIPNAVTVTVGAEGKVSVFNPSGNTNVIVDVVGYYDDSGSGDGFTSLVPVRVQDSRPPPEQVGPYSTPWGPGTDRSVQVAGTGGVPADADAVVANVTVTGTTAESFLTVYPEGAAKPTASSLNWRAGQTIPNAVTIKVGTGGKIRIFNNSGNANVLVDVVGYFKAGTGDSFHPTAPLRIQDSRPAPDTAGAYATPWNAGTSRTVAVPAGMKSVLANVTVTGATAESFVTTWNTGADRPTASSLNFKAGVTIANSVTTKIGPDGSFSAFNNSGNVHVIVDVAGWYG